MALEIAQFFCRDDNFGILIHDSQTDKTAAIDAPNEQAIVTELHKRGWSLTDIFVTHHHFDHVEAVRPLKDRYRCRVIGPAGESDKIPALDVHIKEGFELDFAGHPVTTIETPGHTLGQVAYYIESASAVFAGDTLFSLGCGRIFEGDPAMMWNSLQKLSKLPSDTALYCGHEYTLGNARFALSVDPDNQDLLRRANEVEQIRAQNKPCLPSTIGLERRTNPFLRPDDPQIRRQLAMEDRTNAEVFAELRARKDKF